MLGGNRAAVMSSWSMLPSSEAATVRGQGTGQPGWGWGWGPARQPASAGAAIGEETAADRAALCGIRARACKNNVGLSEGKRQRRRKRGRTRARKPRNRNIYKGNGRSGYSTASPATAAHDRSHGRVSGRMFSPSSRQHSSRLSCSPTFELKGADVFHPSPLSQNQLPERVLVLLRCEMTSFAVTLVTT